MTFSIIERTIKNGRRIRSRGRYCILLPPERMIEKYQIKIGPIRIELVILLNKKRKKKRKKEEDEDEEEAS